MIPFIFILCHCHVTGSYNYASTGQRYINALPVFCYGFEFIVPVLTYILFCYKESHAIGETYIL